LGTEEKYQEYLKSNLPKIESLNEDLKKFLTPEVLAQQEEILTLSKEVYGSGALAEESK
jgi:hypothetical protein